MASINQLYNNILFGMELAVAAEHGSWISIETFEDQYIDRILRPVPSAPTPQGDSDARCSCAICMLPFDVDHQPVQTECGHVFGKDCIKDWLKTRVPNHDTTLRVNTCPMCRRVLFPTTHNGHIFSQGMPMVQQIVEEDANDLWERETADAEARMANAHVFLDMALDRFQDYEDATNVVIGLEDFQDALFEIPLYQGAVLANESARDRYPDAVFYGRSSEDAERYQFAIRAAGNNFLNSRARNGFAHVNLPEFLEYLRTEAARTTVEHRGAASRKFESGYPAYRDLTLERIVGNSLVDVDELELIDGGDGF